MILPRADSTNRMVHVNTLSATLEGTLGVPPAAHALVLFANSNGIGRLSLGNRLLARALRASGSATLVIDLLTPGEGFVDRRTRRLQFDIPLLAERLYLVTDWLMQQPEVAALPLGYFSIGTSAGAALLVAAENPERIGAVVVRSGRPDLAEAALAAVQAPTLLIVGENDAASLAWNQEALAQLRCPSELVMIPGASDLTERSTTLERVAHLAAHWFADYL